MRTGTTNMSFLCCALKIIGLILMAGTQSMAFTTVNVGQKNINNNNGLSYQWEQQQQQPRSNINTHLNVFPRPIIDNNRNDDDHENKDKKTNNKKTLASMMLSAAMIVGGMTTTTVTPTFLVQPAWAAGDSSKVVGEIQGSGLLFKDTLQIERFEDPKVRGVELYIANFQRPLTEKISAGNFFNDPSYASVACVKTGKVSIADNLVKGTSGEEVFEEKRSLLFKDLKVRRVYDEDKKTLIYVSYNTRLDKGEDSNKSRFKSSLCAISLEEPTPSVPDAAPAK